MSEKKPAEDWILARPVNGHQTRAGEVVPSDVPSKRADEKMVEVVAVGPGGTDKDGRHIPLKARVGNRVLVAKSAGKKVVVRGKDYWVLRDHEVLAIMDR